MTTFFTNQQLIHSRLPVSLRNTLTITQKGTNTRRDRVSSHYAQLPESDTFTIYNTHAIRSCRKFFSFHHQVGITRRDSDILEIEGTLCQVRSKRSVR